MENDDRGTNQEIEGDDTRSDRSSELRVDLQNADFPYKAFLRANIVRVLKKGLFIGIFLKKAFLVQGLSCN